MSATLIAITGLIYLGVAVDQLVRGSYPMTAVYLGYAFSNIGLFVLVKDQ